MSVRHKHKRFGSYNLLLCLRIFLLTLKCFLRLYANFSQIIQVHVLSGREGEINNPAIKQLCVTRIETKRVFQTTCHPQCPAEDVSFPEDESASVWVVLYPGTCVYRWNVDKRKIEAKFDAALQKPDNECKFFRFYHPIRNSKYQKLFLRVPDLDIN